MRRFPLATFALLVATSIVSCDNSTTTTTSTMPQEEPRPTIVEVTEAGDEIPTFELYELTVALEAEYENPFDQREVKLDAVFTGPDGREMQVPGFWDARSAWKIRFSAPIPGEWEYSAVVTDARGTSEPVSGTFSAVESDHHGYLYPGSWVDPNLSPRYFVYSDGTPWYGRGHADLRMSFGGLTEDGFVKMNAMKEIGENYEMWWPLWNHNFISNKYDDYDRAAVEMIDRVVREAEEYDITLAYTIWQHQLLRTDKHPWQNDLWQRNGFSKLVTIEGFFVDPESLAWQENFYRYTIARWAYSRAIVMWQTMTEINGSEVYEERDNWHERLNAYFQEHDPWRHPTTACGSGGYDWPEAHAVMDAPQMHVYEQLTDDPTEATTFMAEWSRLMWEREAKPNWIGEWGMRGQQYYPEALHNSLWGTLGAGAAASPIEWNDQYGYGAFDEEMAADMARFSEFIEGIPMAVYNPEALEFTMNDPEVRGWGVVGTGGVIWIQDYSMEGLPVREQSAFEGMRSGAVIEVQNMMPGKWDVMPYDTWTGEWYDSFEIDCPETGNCEIPLPDFHRDIALHVVHS